MLGDRKDMLTRPGLAILAALLLAGCAEGVGLGAGGATADPDAGPAAASGPVDVAAPERFQATEAGLWDGRPSLGGVWVAHPDAQDPERVRIVNRSNGQEVVGALFRRERDLPGPALQVSSDAAEALGMLAGAPAELEVTALRRQEPPEPAEPVEPPEDADAAEDAPVQAPPEPEVATEGPEFTSDPEAVASAAAAILAGAAVVPQPSAGAIATTTLGTTPSDTPSALRSPFVQLGLFDREVNATEAAQQLAAQGLPARVVPSSDGDAWRLLLGPATTEAEQEALLARAVAAGFEDAYLVRS